MSWYLNVLKNYVNFNGRARRKEYWMFVLFNAIISIVLSIIDRLLGTDPIIHLVYGLAVLIPGIAVGIRRLHDIGKSGWWVFINFIPLIGAICFLILTCKDSEPTENAYGVNPKVN